MDKETRNRIQRATQAARRLLEQEVAEQLQGVFDIRPDGTSAPAPGGHLAGDQRVVRGKLVAAIEHLQGTHGTSAGAVAAYVREAAFTVVNRFVALKMLEARGLVLECVSRGEESSGFREFTGLAPGLVPLPDHGYRLYLETIFDEIGREVRALFDRREPASLLWPRRPALLELLGILNDPELAEVWKEDETIGWVYQYFNGDDERKQMRDPKRGGSAAPRNSRELAVRNQFFTPRYVVRFLADNTLGRTWYEMQKGDTRLRNLDFLVRRENEIFLRPSPAEHFPEAQAGIRAACNGDFSKLPEAASWQDVQCLALAIDGLGLAPKLGLGDCGELAEARSEEQKATGEWRGTTMELWQCVFFEQRRWRHHGVAPEGEDLARLLSLYQVLRGRLIREEDIAVTRHRAKKDPRDLKILDPACGSGHFLLYAFDLLLAIYEEAWADPEAAAEAGTGRRLSQDYPDLEALRRDLPALIVERNLHGVDIDPRAAQIAALALWLRAQRAFNEEPGIGPTDRRAITQTHIVVAEPIPGDETLVEAFARTLDPPLLAELFRKMVPEMRLAGELGTLLRVEEGIAGEVARARQAFVEARTGQDFLPGLAPAKPQAELDFSGIDDDRFFAEAEGLILDALRRFAHSTSGTAGLRRKLFSGDAAHGVALIDLVRTRFDVVLMNPPFGAGCLGAKKEFEKSYPRTKNDLYAAFVERGVELLHPGGLLGAITSRTGFFLSSFQRWREEVLLKEAPPVVFADLGYGVLDSAMVEVAAYCLEKVA